MKAIKEKIYQRFLKNFIAYQTSLQETGLIYIPLMTTMQPNNVDPKPFEDICREFVQKSELTTLVLAGSAGSGKTFLTQQVVNHFWLDALVAKDAWVPLWIRLSSVPEEKTERAEFLFRFLCHAEDGPALTRDEYDVLVAKGKLLLFLEGYDELPKASQEINWLKDTNLTKLKIPYKIITTTRPEVFNYLEIVRCLAPRNPRDGNEPQHMKLQQCWLQPFSDFDILEYVRQYIQKIRAQKSEKIKWRDMSADNCLERIKSIPPLEELFRSPAVLSLMIGYFPELWRQVDASSMAHRVITRAKLFDIFKKHWFNKEIERFIKLGQLKESSDWHQSFDRFTQKIAVFMLRNNLVEITDYRDSAVSSATENEAKWQAFFAKLNPGEAMAFDACPKIQIGERQYKFLHKSLLEFFATAELFNGAMGWIQMTLAAPAEEKGSEDLSFEFNKKLYVDQSEIMKFMIDKLKEDQQLVEAFCKIVDVSRSQSLVAIASANAISALNLAGWNLAYLFNNDLSYVRIPGANLSKAALPQVSFKDADLSRVNFTEAWLAEADFTGACVEGAVFKCSLSDAKEAITAVAVSHSGKFLAYGTDHHYLYVYEDKNEEVWRKIQTLKNWTGFHFFTDLETYPISITFVLNEEYLAVFCKRQNVIWLWNWRENSYKHLKIVPNEDNIEEAKLNVSNGFRNNYGALQVIKRTNECKNLEVYFWDWRTAKLIAVLQAYGLNGAPLSQLSFSGADESCILVYSSSKNSSLLMRHMMASRFSLESQFEDACYEADIPDAYAISAKFSPSSKWYVMLLNIKSEKKFWIYDSKKKEKIIEYKLDASVEDFNFSHQNNRFIALSKGSVQVFEIQQSGVEHLLLCQQSIIVPLGVHHLVLMSQEDYISDRSANHNLLLVDDSNLEYLRCYLYSRNAAYSYISYCEKIKYILINHNFIESLSLDQLKAVAIPYQEAVKQEKKLEIFYKSSYLVSRSLLLSEVAFPQLCKKESDQRELRLQSTKLSFHFSGAQLTSVNLAQDPVLKGLLYFIDQSKLEAIVDSKFLFRESILRNIIRPSYWNTLFTIQNSRSRGDSRTLIPTSVLLGNSYFDLMSLEYSQSEQEMKMFIVDHGLLLEVILHYSNFVRAKLFIAKSVCFQQSYHNLQRALTEDAGYFLQPSLKINTFFFDVFSDGESVKGLEKFTVSDFADPFLSALLCTHKSHGKVGDIELFFAHRTLDKYVTKFGDANAMYSLFSCLAPSSLEYLQNNFTLHEVLTEKQNYRGACLDDVVGLTEVSYKRLFEAGFTGRMKSKQGPEDIVKWHEQHEQFTEYKDPVVSGFSQKAMGKQKNLYVHDEGWVVHLIRKKDTNHLCLIIEGVENLNDKPYLFCRRLDFYMHKSNDPRYATFHGVTEAQGLPMLKIVSRQECEELLATIEQCYSWCVEPKAGQQLLASIKSDVQAPSKYSYSGNFFFPARQNCVTYVMQKLKAIDDPDMMKEIKEKRLINAICPTAVIPPARNEQVEQGCAEKVAGSFWKAFK